MLATRLIALRTHLLPQFTPTGTYTDEELDRTRAFRVLVHAEIESYVEERAWAIVLINVQQWKGDRRPRTVIQSLLSCVIEQRAVEKVYNGNSGQVDRIECAVEAAKTAYHSIVERNHGVKGDNILKLVDPLGVVVADQTWLSNMDAFGSDRGNTAHRSALSTTQLIDPRSEWSKIKEIVKGLRKIDKEFDRVL